MKSVLLKSTTLFLFLSLFLSAKLPYRGNGVLTILVNGIQSQAGSVRLVLYNNATTFLERDKHAYRQVLPVGKNGNLTFQFNMPHAFYAVTCYHDINENQRLDQSAFGYPIEPYAMSNNVKVKWRRPTFDETKFAFDKGNQSINLELKKWSDR